MGLASALSTALTGLTAAETTIDVVGNNLANSNTVGFKASTASFATQFLQTKGLGSAPTDTSGGINPRQVGLGTVVADITPNFSQGTVQISANPTDLAIQGDGFFIVEGNNNEHLYSRNGIFKMNAQSEFPMSTVYTEVGVVRRASSVPWTCAARISLAKAPRPTATKLEHAMPTSTYGK